MRKRPRITPATREVKVLLDLVFHSFCVCGVIIFFGPDFDIRESV